MFGNLSLKYKIISGSLIPLLFVIIINLITLKDFNDLEKSLEMVNLTNEVIIKSQKIEKLAVDMQTGMRGYLLTGEEKFLEPFNKASLKVDTLIKEIKTEIAFNKDQVAILEQTTDNLNLWINKIGKVYIEERSKLNLQKEPDASKIMGEITAKQEGKYLFDMFRTNMDKFIEGEYQLLNARMLDAHNKTQDTNKLMVVAVIVSLALSFIISLFLIKTIIEPLNRLKENANEISRGNLQIIFEDLKRGDEIGSLAKSFETMGMNLQKMLFELLSGINILSSSISQILGTTNQLSSSAAETASAVSQTSSTVQEVKQTSQLNASKAQNMEEATKKALNDSNTGQENLTLNAEALMLIQQSMDDIAKNIINLSEKSRLIGEIVIAVEDIASQSKILSVNASIEAVKAGENGKGFSVVAQELKTLAEQSKEGTAKVKKILDDIQNSMNTLVMITEKGGKSVQNGIKKGQDVLKSFETMQETISDISKVSKQIAVSSEQGEAGMKQIVDAMKNIQVASKQNADAIIQVESAVSSLNQLSTKLKNVSKNYNIKES